MDGFSILVNINVQNYSLIVKTTARGGGELSCACPFIILCFLINDPSKVDFCGDIGSTVFVARMYWFCTRHSYLLNIDNPVSILLDSNLSDLSLLPSPRLHSSSLHGHTAPLSHVFFFF